LRGHYCARHIFQKRCIPVQSIVVHVFQPCLFATSQSLQSSEFGGDCAFSSSARRRTSSLFPFDIWIRASHTAQGSASVDKGLKPGNRSLRI
jgi:hypothetical protein